MALDVGKDSSRFYSNDTLLNGARSVGRFHLYYINI